MGCKFVYTLHRTLEAPTGPVFLASSRDSSRSEDFGFNGPAQRERSRQEAPDIAHCLTMSFFHSASASPWQNILLVDRPQGASFLPNPLPLACAELHAGDVASVQNLCPNHLPLAALTDRWTKSPGFRESVSPKTTLKISQNRPLSGQQEEANKIAAEASKGEKVWTSRASQRASPLLLIFADGVNTHPGRGVLGQARGQGSGARDWPGAGRRAWSGVG